MKDEFYPLAHQVEGYWNMPLMHARMRAHQSLNLGSFHHCNDTWFPKHLSQGKIAQVLMPTQYDRRFDEVEMWPRNCLVLGIDVDIDTAEPMGLKIVRFSYNTIDVSDHEFRFSPENYRFLINGFRKDAVLRTGRIETVAFDAGRMNYYLDVMGWVDDKVFPQLEESLDDGYKARRQRFDHRPMVSSYNIENCVCVPSLDPQYYESDFYDFGVPDENFGMTFNDLNAEEQGHLIERLRVNYIIREVQRADMLRHEKSEIKGEKIALRQMNRQKKKFLASYLYSHHNASAVPVVNGGNLRQEIDALVKMMQAEERDLIPEETDGWEDNGPSLRKSDMAKFKEILYGHFGLDIEDEAQNDLSTIFAQTIDPQSLKHFETLGVGGMVRDELSLPEHLWRGRYLMLKIGDIDNEHCQTEAYRPAVLWRAYAKLNDDGMPVLAGLEFYPCTRMSADKYTYKMPVYPFGWRSGKGVNKKQSFLLADKIVRLPVDSPYLHQDYMDSNFRELLPSMIDKFEHKVNRALVEKEGRISVFGLQDIPDDWVEIKLPDAPVFDMQQKLSGWKKADFLEVKPKNKKRTLA